MSATCADCGTRLREGRCGNCHEELVIFEDQNEFLPPNVSDEFMQKVVEQRQQINNREK